MTLSLVLVALPQISDENALSYVRHNQYNIYETLTSVDYKLKFSEDIMQWFVIIFQKSFYTLNIVFAKKVE